MRHAVCLFTLAVFCGFCPGPAWGEKKIPNKDALALQQALQDAIEEAEPSIACILVSRSPRYKEFGAAPSATNPGELGGFDFDYSQLDTRIPAEKAKRALAIKLDLSNVDTTPESFGSGIVVDGKQCLILTNYHVVKDATKVYVRLPGKKSSFANIHAADPRSDLAVLQMIDKVPLTAIKVGDASKVRKGQMILTIANPYAAGFHDGSPSASWGIISNIRRRAPSKELDERERVKTLHHYGTLIQTDTRLNLGCSGGALINLDGEMIGLTSALAALTGTDTPGGFAVPIDSLMRRVIDTLKEGKEVEYGFLGVRFQNPRKVKGIRLGSVVENSPAHHAGLKQGDKILAVNDTPVREIDDIYLPLAQQAPGSIVRLEISRPTGAGNFKKLNKVVTLAKFLVQGKIIATNRREFRGLRVDYTSLLVQPFSDGPISKGVVVCEVKPGTVAADAVKPNDIITQVDGHKVNSPDEFYRAVKRAQGAVKLTLRIGKVTKEVQIN